MAHELRAIYTLWIREIKRFFRQKSRIMGMVTQPLIFLFFIGKGMSSSLPMTGNMDYLKFVYPGIIGMALLMPSIGSGISIVMDREFGFLKEILVAPVSRTSISIGKALGGGTVSLIGGIIVLFLAPFVGISLSPLIIIKLLLFMGLTTFTMTSFGILLAIPMESTEGFQAIMTVLAMPMFFLSGAFFPMEGVSVWIHILMRINPMAYAVDGLRNIIYKGTEMIKMTNFNLFFDIGVIAVFGFVITILAVIAFNIKE